MQNIIKTLKSIQNNATHTNLTIEQLDAINEAITMLEEYQDVNDKYYDIFFTTPKGELLTIAIEEYLFL